MTTRYFVYPRLTDLDQRITDDLETDVSAIIQERTLPIDVRARMLTHALNRYSSAVEHSRQPIHVVRQPEVRVERQAPVAPPALAPVTSPAPAPLVPTPVAPATPPAPAPPARSPPALPGTPAPPATERLASVVQTPPAGLAGEYFGYRTRNKGKKTKADYLAHSLVENEHLDWDTDGHLQVDGQLVAQSNVSDIFAHLMSPKGDTPKGTRHMLTALAKDVSLTPDKIVNPDSRRQYEQLILAASGQQPRLRQQKYLERK